MKRAVNDNSVSSSVGSRHLAMRLEQILADMPSEKPHTTIGALQVIAGQAIRELERAERTSKDPVDLLRAEDAAQGTGSW